MERKVRLILTDSYFNVFGILNNLLEGKTQGLTDFKNLVFCEEKISLMAERFILSKAKSTFNTDVYSFGNYLRKKRRYPKTLSKEGSAMAIRKILSQVSLSCFKGNKAGLAPELYELIIQLKSAKISPEEVKESLLHCAGVLKSKLTDIYTIYSAYEKFLTDNEYVDQSALLNDLSEELEKDTSLKDTDVYLLGYTSLTNQARQGVKSLFKSARSVTAIFTAGDNPFAFVNETATALKKLCQEEKVPFEEVFVKSDYALEGKTIIGDIFKPRTAKEKLKTDKIYITPKQTANEEVYSVAETIKQAVISNKARYRDFTVSLSSVEDYKEDIKRVFNELEIPFFLDESYSPVNHPLIRLILDYYEVFNRNFERDRVISLIKNPLVSSDRKESDGFCAYIKKYNINFDKFLQPFTIGAKEEIDKFEPIRLKLFGLLSEFNLSKFLSALDLEVAIKTLGEKLSAEEKAVNDQILEKTLSLLAEQETLLAGVKLNFSELKSVFLSGAKAMELSILPQYNDAVFVGKYRETALAKADYLFMLGLSAEVPRCKADVSLLTDNDISRLSELKVLVEPKIKIVNARERENTAMAISAFNKMLFVSYPLSSVGGKSIEKSVIIDKLTELFTVRELKFSRKYLTKKQGLKSFAKSCKDYSVGEYNDFDQATAFYYASKDTAKPILDRNNSELKLRVTGKGSRLIGGETSPTTVESFYRCPYSAFCSKVLRLKEEEKGEVDHLSIGNIVHEIVEKFVVEVYKNKTLSVTDKNSCDEACVKCAEEVLSSKQQYKSMLLDPETLSSVERVISEAKKYCYICFAQFKNSKFVPHKTEAKIGNGGEYPALEFMNGAVKLVGKVDRIDTYTNANDKYFRVVDYKTGRVDDSLKGLYSGQKLQLYLYSKAVNEGEVAGVYYMDLADAYIKDGDKVKPIMVGKTLATEEVARATDTSLSVGENGAYFDIGLSEDGSIKNGISKNDLENGIEYAYRVAEKGIEYMADGVIVASPVENACSSCKYFALCDGAKIERKIGSVTAETIESAVKGGRKNGNE